MSSNTRAVAADVITKVLHHGLSLTAALDAALPALAQTQDQAFVQALCYGVIRHFYRLDFILRQLLDKPLKDAYVKALALVGLYQLAFMRVKPHAAVSETVRAARKKAWAKALINALLRTYLREREALERNADQQPDIVSGHPDWLVEKITRDWPEQAQSILRQNNLQAPMVLRVNLAKTHRADYLRRLAESGIAAEPVAGCDSALVLDQPVAIGQLPGFADGWVSVQDAAAQWAAELLAVEAGQRVLDVCAAPGGKTGHILERYPRLQELVALDIDAARLRRVDDNLRRLGLSATLLTGDATRPEDWWDGRPFDRILLDAPCSGLGVIRRHPDIKLLRRAEDIDALQALQSAILHAVWPLLARGGLLLYATCSVLKQENERQIEDFLTRHDDAVARPFTADWGRAAGTGRQILTGDAGMDGFFYARVGKL